MESTKDRRKDVAQGRFLDKELFVCGYEAPHMLTEVAGLGDRNEKLPRKIISTKFDDMEINGKIYENQGYFEMEYVAKDDTKVSFYTSMLGEIKFWKDYLKFPVREITFGRKERYRIISVRDDESDIEITGQYEPIPREKRGTGRIFVVEKGEIVYKGIIEDNHMKYHLEKCINYLIEKSNVNPSPPSLAFEIVETLWNCVKIALT